MAEKPLSPRDITARVMSDGKKVLVPHLARLLGRDGISEVDAAEERRRFWQRAKSVEEEQQLWAEEMTRRGIAQLTPGAPETIEMGFAIAEQVYPDRFDMLERAGRDHGSDQAAWAMKWARKGPPEEPSAPAVPAAVPLPTVPPPADVHPPPDLAMAPPVLDVPLDLPTAPPPEEPY